MTVPYLSIGPSFDDAAPSEDDPALETTAQAILTKLGDITNISNALRVLARSDAGTAGMATALAEINAGATAGDYSNTTHSLEAGYTGDDNAADWTPTERAQIRYRLGLNGTATAPTDPTPDPIVVTPGTGNTTTGYYTVLDKNLDPEPGVTVYAKMLDAYDTDTGFIYSGEVLTSVSNAYGVCEFTMIKGASYRCWRTSPTPTAPISLIVVPLDAGTTTPLKSLVRI